MITPTDAINLYGTPEAALQAVRGQKRVAWCSNELDNVKAAEKLEAGIIDEMVIALFPGSIRSGNQETFDFDNGELFAQGV